MSLKLNSSGGGSVTLQEPSTATNGVLTLPAGTGNVTVNGLNSNIVLGTDTATTSGTTVTVATSIPDWVRRVTVMLYGVSTNGTSRPMLQFGTGSTPTYVTSGYATTSDNYSTTAGPASTSTAGFVCGSTSTAASTWYVTYTFTTLGSNKWIGVVGGSTAGGAGVVLGGGYITLGATLTAIRITTPSGTDVFDAGTINILYE